MNLQFAIFTGSSGCIFVDTIVLAIAVALLCVLWCRYFASTYYWQYNVIEGVRLAAIWIGLFLFVREAYRSGFNLPASSLISRLPQGIPPCSSLVVDMVLLVSQVTIFRLAWRFFKPVSWLKTRLWWKNSRKTQEKAIRHISSFARQGDQAAIRAVLRFADEPLSFTRFPVLKNTLAMIASKEVHDFLYREAGNGSIAAIEVLGQIGRPESVDVLLQVLPKLGEESKTAVVKILAQLNDSRAIVKLIGLAAYSNSSLIEAAWTALHQLGASHEQKVDFCVSAVGRSSPSIQALACKWLGDLGDHRGISAITPLFGWGSKSIVEAAVSTLERLRPTPEERFKAYRLAAKNIDNTLRQWAVGELTAFNSPAAIEALTLLCGDESGPVCKAALDALGQLDTTYEHLIQAYGRASSNSDVAIRELVAERLGELDGSDAITILLRMCKDGCQSVFDIALRSLRQVGATFQDVSAIVYHHLEELDRELNEAKRQVRAAQCGIETNERLSKNYQMHGVSPYQDMSYEEGWRKHYRDIERYGEMLEEARAREALLNALKENVRRRKEYVSSVYR